jgi:cold shock protein
MDNETRNGVVKFFKEDKGFGFIVEDGSNQEIFVHVSGLVDQVDRGDQVTFETQKGKKGINAVNVKKA